jgi:chemotaxis protein methyltransferase CheR
MWPNPLEFFANYIERETGIAYSGSNLYQLQIRLEEICRTESIPSVDELAKRFQSSPVDLGLKQKLLDLSTNNETLFFRDPAYFVAIETFIVETLMKENPREIKIWSAASSTGQEALSIAITLEELSLKKGIPSYQISATDICDKAIKKCKSGLYTDFEVMRGLSPERREKYFKKEGEGWRVQPSLHSKIKFGYNNLIRSSVYEKFHIILCRNVLIYQKVDMKRTVIETLFHQLQTSGAILLGAGETMVGVRENVVTEVINGVTFYKRIKDGVRSAAS